MTIKTHYNLYEENLIKFALPFQVVDLLNQAALMTTDDKLTVLKQVGSLSFC